LLSPSHRAENQYRMYSQQDLIELQKILFLKGLGVPLKNIEEMMKLEDEKLREALTSYQGELLAKIEKLQKLNRHLTEFLEGEALINLDIFNQPLQDQYAKEAEIKYGETPAYQSYQARTASQSNEDFKEVQHRMDAVFEKFNTLAEQQAPLNETQSIVVEWKKVMRENADFSDEVLVMIAQGYEQNPRFKDYFKKFGNSNLPSYIAKHVTHHLE
ncbi:MerR family transcriptional regulator, partial [Staphylococcus argensis]